MAVTVLLAASLSHGGYQEVFEKEFLMADWAGTQEKSSVCVACHSSGKMDQEMHNLVREWRHSWHAANDVSCHDCHGGAPEDASSSMSHDRGFVGTPADENVPQLCGTCHIAIMKNYLSSGHGQNFCVSPDGGPNCITCHGSHNIQQASIDIISEEMCSECHSYERAELMKQALYAVEDKMTTIKHDLNRLQRAGIPLQDQEKTFFRAHSEYRTIFHTIDIELVKEKSNEFMEKLAAIEVEIESADDRLAFRRNFSAFLLLIFAGLSGVVFLLTRSDNK
jgi:hypothetical protein